MREILAAEKLVKDFGSGPILKGLDFALQGPQLIGILGPNGAGKTTLLDLLEGLTVPTSGQIRLFGEPLRAGHYPKKRVGVVLQKECAFDAIRVGEYAELFAAIQGVAGGRERILEQAALQQRASVSLARLSGGEAQRLFLAAATVHAPELLFLDEPTAHLDPAGRRQVGELLKEMKVQRTIVMTTHDLHEAESLFDSVVFLVGGEIKAQGPLAGFLESAGSLEEAFFSQCSIRISRQGDLQ